MTPDDQWPKPLDRKAAIRERYQILMRRGLTVAFGLIVTFQGFETSRYIEADYESRTRIHSMRWAQRTNILIYMSDVLLLAFVFERGELTLSETVVDAK